MSVRTCVLCGRSRVVAPQAAAFVVTMAGEPAEWTGCSGPPLYDVRADDRTIATCAEHLASALSGWVSATVYPVRPEGLHAPRHCDFEPSFPERVERWEHATFPTATTIGRARHLVEEARELVADVEAGQMHRAIVELADVALLVWVLAWDFQVRYGLVLGDAMAEKFDELQRRRWLPADESGVHRHAPEG